MDLNISMLSAPGAWCCGKKEGASMSIPKKGVVFFLGVMLAMSSLVQAESPDISNGHRILLDLGLQIHALAFVSETGYFDPDIWACSNFTAVDMYTPYATSLMPAEPGIPWSRWIQDPDSDIRLQEQSYLPNLIRIQVEEKQDITNSTILTDLTATVADLHSKYPNVMVHTVQPGPTYTAAQIQSYMTQVQPDILMFDDYPFDGELSGGSPEGFYSDLEKYRLLGLAGNNGTGSNPIPVGCYTQTFTSTTYTNDHVVSESEIRLNQFAAWAYGCTIVDAYIFDDPQQEPGSTAIKSILFDGEGTDSPTAQFYYAAETNRQSRNIGKALTRLISTDVYMIMGQHDTESGVVNNAQPIGVTTWTSAADPYITSIRAINLGDTNDGLRGDVIVSYFKPLDAAFTNAGHDEDVYFMITNGLSDASGTAAECQQAILMNFNFGTSGITQLQRISRETGEVESVPLTRDGWRAGYYHTSLVLDGGTGDLFKFDNGGTFVTEPEAPEVQFTLREVLPGTWAVFVDVTGGSAGLAAYDIMASDADANFVERRLGTVVDSQFVGFAPANLVQGEVQGIFDAGNFQGCGDDAILGIGMEDLFVDADAGFNDVSLDAHALLGILNTEDGLTEGDFAVPYVGLFNEFGDGYCDSDSVVPTLVVVPYSGSYQSIPSVEEMLAEIETRLLMGDANRDGIVSAADYAAVQAFFGSTGQAGIPGDANGDGVVSAADYAAVQANFGSSASSSVPEPATVTLLVLGGAGVLIRRNRVW